MEPSKDTRIGIVGLGYVGLPLAAAFGRIFDTIGFDIDDRRIADLEAGIDRTQEIRGAELAEATRLTFTNDIETLRSCNIYVVAVPTPVDAANRPDLAPLEQASSMLARVLSRGDIVIYESTVYPGTTEEVCVPLLETGSGLAFNLDFFCGYSPERIVPGDREHPLAGIVKVTSGSTPRVAEQVDQLYRTIITAGTHKAPSIKVAEAAKVIENTQRDVNIALVNELAMIFNKMGIDTSEVLAAAGTKWNFMQFRPGLVGGHCIGVDPYYLTHKATVLGYHPELILTARRINSRMGLHVAHQVLRLMARKRINVVDSRILVMGITFKENCSDLRNTRVIDVVRELEAACAHVDVFDPLADPDAVEREFGLRMVAEPVPGTYDAVVLAVAHQQFLSMGPGSLERICKSNCVIFDVKSQLPAGKFDGRL